MTHEQIKDPNTLPECAYNIMVELEKQNELLQKCLMLLIEKQ